MGIMAALFERSVSGKGQVVESDMVSLVFCFEYTHFQTFRKSHVTFTYLTSIGYWYAIFSHRSNLARKDRQRLGTWMVFPSWREHPRWWLSILRCLRVQRREIHNGWRVRTSLLRYLHVSSVTILSQSQKIS